MAKVKFKLGDIVQLNKKSKWSCGIHTYTNPINMNGKIIKFDDYRNSLNILVE